MVRQDEQAGLEFIRGKPRLRPIAVHAFGGMLDTVERRFSGASENPIVWYTGERTAELLLDIWLEREQQTTRTLLIAAEGFGKTMVMMQAHIVFLLTMIRIGQPGAMGCTAPTDDRLQTCLKALGKLVPIDRPRAEREGSWGTYFEDDRELRWASGHITQCRQTKRQSEATGSPIQGYTWLRSDDDEVQDTWENGEADADIEARLRESRVSYRWGTATAKDSPKYRSIRDMKGTSTDWRIVRFPYTDAPFIFPEHWARMKRNVSPREWQRRGLAQDVGPELMTYPTWNRDENLRPIPLGAKDVTAELLSQWGPRYGMLVGHDPGKIVDVSIFLRAYMLRMWSRPRWWVVDELTTDVTTEEHVSKFVPRIRLHGCNRLDAKGRPLEDGPRVLVRADPYSDSGNDEKQPDRTVYKQFAKVGVDIRPAAYAKDGSGPGVVPKEAGIELVCSLLCNAEGERRLYIACDDRRQPVAPKLVEALELSQRDEGTGKAETQKKNRQDRSHWPAALRYPLWTVERVRMAA